MYGRGASAGETSWNCSVIKSAFDRPAAEIFTKANATDLVTETDRHVEQLLFNQLRENFPDHKFIGEETAAESDSLLQWTDDPTWIIDPIDGTSNFVHKLPHVAVSVGLSVNKDIILGIIYNPILDVLYTAIKGQGAYKNGVPIKTSKTKNLCDAMISTAVGSVREPTVLQAYQSNFTAFLDKQIRGHRSIGSAALHMAFVAEGSLNVFLEYGIHCWDIAAGTLIVREAGGVVVDPTGSDIDLMRRRVLCAGTGDLAAEISPIITHTDFPSEVVEV